MSYPVAYVAGSYTREEVYADKAQKDKSVGLLLQTEQT